MQDNILGPGFRSGNLVVISDGTERTYGDKRTYKTCKVRCDCGFEYEAISTAIKSKKIKKCTFCSRKLWALEMKKNPAGLTHGASSTSEYISWTSMKYRCANTKNPAYYLYGGRGITVCESWKESFENFLSDMGLKPFKGAQIDRVDCDGNYEPSNCRWVSPIQNNKNRRWSQKNRDNYIMIRKDKLCESCRNAHAR
jgi:hypothetical protein